MRILVVGAGGIGGYFGGRLLEAGRDVTFLVRPRRAALLAERGLVIRSPAGDVTVHAPPTILADALQSTAHDALRNDARPSSAHYDLILLSCKSYDLDDAMRAFAPAVGPRTMIMPMLNGMRHMDALRERFGDGAVLGGLCMIASTIDGDGAIVHLNAVHTLVFGERDGSRSERVLDVERAFSGARFDLRLSDTIVQEMWEKWVFIATGAGMTCLMRASVGDIEAAGGAGLVIELARECAAIAARAGYPPSDEAMARTRAMFTTPGSPLTASMYRDIERGGATEGEHLLGDLLRRGDGAEHEHSMLRVAYTHVATYEVQRARLAVISAG